MSERRTDATESGSWLGWTTPQAHDAQGIGDAKRHGRFGTKHGGRNLPDHVAATEQNWVTPQARDWVTPTAAIATGGQTSRSGARKGELLLSGQAQQTWPTAAARDWRDDGDCPSAQARKSPCLPAAVEMAMWPTATATDAKASGAAGYSTASGRHSGTTLTDATVGPRGPESRSTSGKSRARLNHRWVAQLMGYPSDWLDGIDAQP